MRVVIAEKPSVARDLARVLGATSARDGWLEGPSLAITWCFGHMAELEEPSHYDERWKRWSLDTLPMIPTRFDVKLRDGAKEQFAVIQRLVKQATDVVNACDAGREGELIFRWVAEMAKCRAPVLRLWVSSLTDTAIRAGWAQLRPGRDYDRLGDAARSRSEADWLVGLNATRALTCLARDQGGGQLLSVGRVQTPTLAMIVGRDAEIAAFVPETYWHVKATFVADGDGPEASRTFVAAWFREGQPESTAAKVDSDREPDDDDVAHAERISRPEVAAAIAAAAAGGTGTIHRAERRRTVEKPPLLYDLTALQRRANQRYGLSADQTLTIAQALYEQHKLITYPRTDARYLTPDQVPGLGDIVRGLQPVSVYAPFCASVLAKPIQPGSRVVNAAEVGDHHAILPTGKTPDSQRLSPDEKRVFDLVARRFLAALSDDAWFDVTRLVVHVPPHAPLPEGVVAPLAFRARGRVCRQVGWRAVDPPRATRDVDLPPVGEGDAVATRSAEVVEGQTRPPRPHNDASILQAMETAGRQLDDKELARAMRGCGLGTPATRASILTVLIERGYVQRVGKDLRATDKGVGLIGAVPVDALKSPELTGLWEGRLSEVADGKAKRDDFMRDVRTWVTELVQILAASTLPAAAVIPSEATKSLGDCPVCGKPVRERGPVYACDTGRSCSFVVFKTMAKRAISPRSVTQLLKGGRTPAMKGFTSKAGKPFTAALEWSRDEQRVRLLFEDPPASEAPDRARRDPTPAPSPKAAKTGTAKPKKVALKPGDSCPVCGAGTLIQGRERVGCSRWREGCTYTG